MTDVQQQSGTRPDRWENVPGTSRVYYRPRYRLEPPRVTPALPTPPIRARQFRGRSIHIVSYPPGFIPPELRPPPEPTAKQKKKQEKKEEKKRQKDAKKRSSVASRESITKSTIERIFAPFVAKAQSFTQTPPSRPPTRRQSTSGSFFQRLSIHWSDDRAEEDLPGQNNTPVPEATPVHDVSPALNNTPAQPEPPAQNDAPTQNDAQTQDDTTTQDETLMALRTPALMEAMRPSYTSPYAAPVHRQSISSVRNAKNAVSSLVSEVPKPVAAGSGVACSILLAEPNIFLNGFEHEGHRPEGQGGTALLRGRLQLVVTKNVKIKGVSLKLVGKARTEWPEGIPPLKVDVFEEESLRTQVLTFFNAMNDGWETEFGNQCTYKLKNNSPTSTTGTPTARASLSPANSNLSIHPARNSMTAKEMKRLSLQSNQSRSFGKGEAHVSTAQAKGYKVFYPGTYDYAFELPIDHHQLETIKLQYGSVKWELHAQVERAGAFKPNLHGQKEVSIVRVPDQLSLETTEPISISRQWEDQLHYDIIISGKSFPLGTKIPVAFKLTPLAKVQVHKLKVFCTETVEYWTNDRRVTRKDPGRKILLLEKVAGKPLDAQFNSSEVRVLSGGELTPRERREAREAAALRRSVEASRRGVLPQALPEASDNLLGDLDLGLESYWGSTEIEMDVQLPTCEQMAKSKELRLTPDCSWKNVNVYHWIKVSPTFASHRTVN